MGSYHIGQALGYRNVIASDVGGTSFDLGMVVDASVRSYEFRPIIDRWMVGISMLQATTMGAGGGSIAWINTLLGNRLEVGPRSAGSYPGPGLLRPGRHRAHDHRRRRRARLHLTRTATSAAGCRSTATRPIEAIRTKIAEPLGVSVDEAAALIRRIIEQNMASAIEREVHLRGYHPEDFVLFAFGGGGPTHVAGYRRRCPHRGDLPAGPGVLGAGQLGHGHHARLRAVQADPLPRRDDPGVHHRPRGLQRPDPGHGHPGARRPDGGGTRPRPGRLLRRARHALRRAGAGEAGVLARCWRSTARRMRSAVYEAFEKEFSEAFSPHVVNKPGGVYIDIDRRSRRPCRRRSSSSRSTSSARADPERARQSTREPTGPSSADAASTRLSTRSTSSHPATRVEGPASDRGRVHHHRRPARSQSVDRRARPRPPATPPAPIRPRRPRLSARRRSWKERRHERYPTPRREARRPEGHHAHRVRAVVRWMRIGHRGPTRSASSAPRTSSTRATRCSCGRRGRRWAWPATRSSRSSPPQGDLVNASAGTLPARGHPTDRHQVHPPTVRDEPGHRRRRHLVHQRRPLRRHPQSRPGRDHAGVLRGRAGRVDRGPDATPPRPAPASPAACRSRRSPASTRA